MIKFPNELQRQDDALTLPEVDGFTNISHLDPAAQFQLLHAREQVLRARQLVDYRLFFLRGGSHAAVLAQMRDLQELDWDVDGTLNDVGGRRLFLPNLLLLQEAERRAFRNVVYTGRHFHQVQELRDNHPDGFGVHTEYIEQGFFKMNGTGGADHHLGNTELEEHITAVREHFERVLPGIAAAHNVRFVVTSSDGYAEAHRSMASFDVIDPRTGLKILPDQFEVHERVSGALRESWQEVDPSFRRAVPGTSSTGTIEFALRGINKARAKRKHKRNYAVQPGQSSYAGDSSNDQEILQQFPEDLGVVVMNPHTKLTLLEHAKLATVGVGNAVPFLRKVLATKNGD